MGSHIFSNFSINKVSFCRIRRQVYYCPLKSSAIAWKFQAYYIMVCENLWKQGKKNWLFCVLAVLQKLGLLYKLSRPQSCYVKDSSKVEVHLWLFFYGSAKGILTSRKPWKLDLGYWNTPKYIKENFYCVSRVRACYRNIAAKGFCQWITYNLI